MSQKININLICKDFKNYIASRSPQRQKRIVAQYKTPGSTALNVSTFLPAFKIYFSKRSFLVVIKLPACIL